MKLIAIISLMSITMFADARFDQEREFNALNEKIDKAQKTLELLSIKIERSNDELIMINNDLTQILSLIGKLIDGEVYGYEIHSGSSLNP